LRGMREKGFRICFLNVEILKVGKGSFFISLMVLPFFFRYENGGEALKKGKFEKILGEFSFPIFWKKFKNRKARIHTRDWTNKKENVFN